MAEQTQTIALTNTTLVVPTVLAASRHIKIVRFLPRIVAAGNLLVTDPSGLNTLLTIPVLAGLVSDLPIGADVQQYKGTGAKVDVTADNTTDTFTAAGHALGNRMPVRINSTGTMPGGFTINQQYFVVARAANTFQLSFSPDGAAIDITSNGTATISVYPDTLQPGFAFKTSAAGLDGSLVIEM